MHCSVYCSIQCVLRVLYRTSKGLQSLVVKTDSPGTGILFYELRIHLFIRNVGNNMGEYVHYQEQWEMLY
jgi:hypothetical protein